MQRIQSEGNLEDPNHRQTVVIKIGTTSLIRADRGTLNLSSLAGVTETVSELRRLGFNVIIVSSGAVGTGCQVLGLKTRPKEIAKKQALAAIGQIHLMRQFDDFFSALQITCSQVLLTRDNLVNRTQYVNARATFLELLEYGAVPIINENDTLAVEELNFGDNDTLSAQVAAMVGARWLFLLTDVDALYTGNPNADPSARRIPEVADLSSLNVSTSAAPDAPAWGTGGMATKLTAARIATAAGVTMAICHFKEPEAIVRVIGGSDSDGTVFRSLPKPVRGRKKWILAVPTRGEVVVDAGAARALRRRSSLFAVGIKAVRGAWHPQDAIKVLDARGEEIARGLANYGSDDVHKVIGKKSRELSETLGYAGPEEIVHRANLCILVRHADPDHPRSAASRAAAKADPFHPDNRIAASVAAGSSSAGLAHPPAPGSALGGVRAPSPWDASTQSSWAPSAAPSVASVRDGDESSAAGDTPRAADTPRASSTGPFGGPGLGPSAGDLPAVAAAAAAPTSRSSTPVASVQTFGAASSPAPPDAVSARLAAIRDRELSSGALSHLGRDGSGPLPVPNAASREHSGSAGAMHLQGVGLERPAGGSGGWTESVRRSGPSPPPQSNLGGGTGIAPPVPLAHAGPAAGIPSSAGDREASASAARFARQAGASGAVAAHAGAVAAACGVSPAVATAAAQAAAASDDIDLSTSPVASGWTAALRQAVAAEVAEAAAAGDARIASGEDIDEGGWLPK